MSEYQRHTGEAGDRERSPEEIEREIELTRERMSRDIDALGEKLSPQNLKRQAKEAITGKAHDVVNNVGDQARDTGTRIFDFIRDHPLPVAAVGLGAVWLIQQRNRSEISGDRMARFAYTGPERRGTSVRRRIADRAGELRAYVGETTQGIGERAGEFAGGARERVTDLGRGAKQRVGEQTRRARNELDHLMDDNPLVLAAGAAILGLAIGLLVPETERENQLMGPSRDNLVDRAQSTAQRVKEAAVDATNEVREVVREEAASRAPEIKEAIKDAAATVGASVKESAGRVKEEAKQAAKESKSGGRGDPQV
jgi:ElaB/YqjD/DUF883 family membrane-anchored ribosome-binding protein